MNRSAMLQKLNEMKIWDMLIIGGGATGIGTAIDAASRGYKTLLIEQDDFGKGTSSRSTKLVHGGVRYLQQGNISLVLEALKERGILHRNAPHLVHDLPFIVPSYDWWEGPFYGIGLKLYDLLAGREGFGTSKLLSKEKTIEQLPTIETDGLNGGVIYYDGQFDDARLIIDMAKTAGEQGAVVLNYVRAESLLQTNGMISGLIANDLINDREIELSARVVINATGVFSDAVRQMDEPDAQPMIKPSQGVHIVLDKSFLPGQSAIMVPHTDDGRVLFAIPWHDKVVLGTTDTPMDDIPLEPVPIEEEIEFLISHAARYLTKDPTRNDVLSMFAGLRPLVSAGDAENTAAISRDHTICISRSGLVTVAGGKWTTYRKMAEDTVDQASIIAQLDPVACRTQDLNIHGYHQKADQFGTLDFYGSAAMEIEELAKREKRSLENLAPGLPISEAQVVWAVREEMAQNLDDVLSRRTRCLLLNARESKQIAQRVAQIMAKELNKNKKWLKNQVEQYHSLAEHYHC